MTNQEKKEYLKQINNIDRRVDYLLTAIEKEKVKRDRLLSISVNYENDGTQNGSNSNGTESKMIAHADIDIYIESLQDDVQKLYKLKQTIKTIVNNVSDPICREILFRRYINAENDDDICSVTGYSKSQYWKLHGDALTAVNIGQNRTE